MSERTRNGVYSSFRPSYTVLLMLKSGLLMANQIWNFFIVMMMIMIIIIIIIIIILLIILLLIIIAIMIIIVMTENSFMRN